MLAPSPPILAMLMLIELICESSWLTVETSRIDLCVSLVVEAAFSVSATFWVESRNVLRSDPAPGSRGRLDAGSLAAALKSLNTVLSWLR